jgi:hypothetical protein
MATQQVAQIYYFNPLSQECSLEKNYTGPSACIKLFDTLPVNMLEDTIRRLGNYIAIIGVRKASEETQRNQCTNYIPYREICQQNPLKDCQEHLTKEEIDECVTIEKLLKPPAHFKVVYSLDTPKIDQGDTDLMRRILTAVRDVKAFY